MLEVDVAQATTTEASLVTAFCSLYLMYSVETFTLLKRSIILVALTGFLIVPAKKVA